MLQREFLFPTPVWYIDLELDNTQLEEYVYQLRDTDPQGVKVSNINGWQSQSLNDFPLLTQPILSNVKTIIEQLSYTNITPNILNYWANINSRDCFNEPHYHARSFLSGVYYVKTTPQSGGLTFYRNHEQSYIIQSIAPISQQNHLTTPTIQYQAIQGRLILFQSHLVHAVSSNHDDHDRISIAFNIGG